MKRRNSQGIAYIWVSVIGLMVLTLLRASDGKLAWSSFFMVNAFSIAMGCLYTWAESRQEKR